MQNWDLVTEPNVQVLADTLNEGNKRGDWMKHWLMLQGYTALNTMYRKTLDKQTTYRSPKGNEKQIDYILTKRRYFKYNNDAEANDMIHMRSDHRCVMATFTIITPEKSSHWQQGIKQEKLKLRSLSSKKHTKRSLKKNRRHNSSASRKRKCRSTSKKMRRQQQKQKMKIRKRKQKKSKERAQESW